ncbi:unnamed protein product [Bursaphelenchus xylophilus]|uniref:(pine wood nematode) hypothetical protein n=1 Tax=Bursaphelenchus xylophilus TaxID=6326 RepID=A0A1I7RHU0_BURXY|nr:unnamed protein product [Bursaphelenchus xylophilus]CAG9115387.1 unnamed protein product [Bursaphelenchus xylophilus]
MISLQFLSFFTVFLTVTPVTADSSSECFDQQYSNHIADFRALHTIQRIAVVAPLSAFYVHVEITDGAEQVVKRENGEPLIVYSSISSASIDWQSLNVLARAVRVVSVFDDKDDISPVIIVTACPYRTRPVYLDAQPFAVDAYRVGLVSMYENELAIVFRTFEDGIFFFSMADQGDMLVAQLVSGRVECLFDFGSLSRASITGGRALNDGEWHELRWTHQFDSVQLFIDGVLVNSTVPSGLYRKLDFNFQVEVGGRPEDQYSAEIETSFHGCLAKVMLNNVDLLSMAPKTARDCQMPKPQILSIRSGSVQIPYSFLPFALEFRILSGPTPVLSILDSMNGTLLELRVDEHSHLILEADAKQLKQLSTPAVDVTDGSWHALSVKLRGGRLDVDVDGYTVLWLEGSLVRKIGLKMTSFRISAAGCFRSATVDLKSASLVMGDIIRDKCGYSDKCLPNPCENNGKCLQVDLDKFKCECTSQYTGTYCHTSLLPRSCEDHYNRKKAQSSGLPSLFGKLRPHYSGPINNITIDLDGGGPLKPLNVLCSHFNDNSQAESTVLEHNVVQGVYVTGPTEPGAVRRGLDYGVDGEELDRFIDGFESCKQFMRFECQGGAKLMSYGQERRPSTWYATRNGQHGLQWADAPPFSRMCSCAINSSCSHNKMCNCDSGRDGIDEGYNTHSQLLPIMQLYVGGTQQSSSVNISVGPLRCQRRQVYETVTFIDRNQNVVGTQSFGLGTVFDIYLQVRFSHSQMTIFTWESANGERWYQLFVRDGKVVGQIVNAGRSHEIVSDVNINDNEWHTIYWEADPQTAKLVVDRHEKTVSAFFILPDTFTFILGSRTGRGNAGYAGQIRGLYLCGKEIQIAQLVRKLNPMGVQIGDTGYCRMNRCANGANCVEYYDNYKCNCSMTPFSGEQCDQEVGMWIPTGSSLQIPWQHPAQVATCYRINVQTAISNVSLIRARALFAESAFNMSIDITGHLNIRIFDGFFYSKNLTDQKIIISDDKTKDIEFCANRQHFNLSVNAEQIFSLEGNFTFFINLNQWRLISTNFTGCISRLQIGSSFPLKNPNGSRMKYSGKIKFGSCPFDPLQYQPIEEPDEKPSEIQISSVIKNQQKLLIITPAIGIITAIFLAVLLCIVICYIRSRPDGVYKTNENVVPYSSKSVEPLVHEHPYSKEYFC